MKTLILLMLSVVTILVVIGMIKGNAIITDVFVTFVGLTLAFYSVIFLSNNNKEKKVNG